MTLNESAASTTSCGTDWLAVGSALLFESEGEAEVLSCICQTLRDPLARRLTRVVGTALVAGGECLILNDQMHRWNLRLVLH